MRKRPFVAARRALAALHGDCGQTAARDLVLHVPCEDFFLPGISIHNVACAYCATYAVRDGRARCVSVTAFEIESYDSRCVCPTGVIGGMTNNGPPKHLPWCPLAEQCKCLRAARQAPHVCPYAYDVHGDYATLCTCCDACTAECAGDI